MPIIYAGSTDIGQKRKTNQDSILIAAQNNLFVVADGMGGHSGGDIASQTVVETLKDIQYDEAVYGDPASFLQYCVSTCNQKIFEKAIEDSALKGMGTTITCAYVHEDRLFVANVGDSRAYLINKEEIFQLTKDHSLVQERVNHGIYSRIAARKDPMKNILIRSVGFEEKVEVDVFEYRIRDNDFFIICSDGLYNKLNDETLIQQFNQHISSGYEDIKTKLMIMVEDFIDAANNAGGEDNISVIMLHAKP